MRTGDCLGPRMSIDPAGFILGSRRVLSPNFDQRPVGEQITLLVIHSISLPPGEFGGSFVEALFTNSLDCSKHIYFEALRGLRVSAHFFIRRDGSLVQFVSCHDRAWHAGQSEWKGRVGCNDFSIGIELEGADTSQFTVPQYAGLVELSALLRSRFPISDIVGHADISPGRKSDPGPFFDWSFFRSELNSVSVRF